MGARGKHRTCENYETFGDEWKTKNSGIKGCMKGFTHRLCRPLRIFQFLMTLLLFAMAVYMTAMEDRHLSDLASILLIILTSAYLFFMAIDIISQFEAYELPDAPMFLFSLLGALFFAIAGALLIQYSVMDTFWALVLAKILCFIISLLFLMEVTMLLTSWRQRCVSWTKCYPYTPRRDCGRLMLFPGDDTCKIDAEDGCRIHTTTSVSNNEVPMEDIDTAVAQHGCRRISVGHRRQYVDRDSSASPLSVMQIAEIQTDRERTTITECQTQKTETKEMVIQTNSRCELCNRQMDDRSVSPTKFSTQSASVASQSQYSPSPRLSSVPYTDQAVLATDTVRSNLSTPITPDPHIQGSPCTVCPAFLQMMREGIASPCCKSCNCEAGKHRLGRVLEPASESCNSEMQSPRWSQREPQRTPKSSSTAKPPGSGSPSTNNEKSDAERSDLMIEEGNRRRPNKKISRVYETRPCPTHGSGLAARMAGLPETVTTVTLSSISVRRNKRTQTPNKDSMASGDNRNRGVNEDIPNETAIEGKIFGYKEIGENRQSNEEQRARSRSEDTNERPSEERIKLRISSCVTPRKLYRNSAPISPSKEPATPPTDCCVGNKCRAVSEKEEKITSPRAMSWRSDGAEKRKSTEIVKMERRSIMSDESLIKEEAIEEPTREGPRISKFRTPIKEETIHEAEVEGPRTSKFRRPLTEEAIEVAEVEGPRTSKFRRPLTEEAIEVAEVEGSRSPKFRRSFKEEMIEDAEVEGPRTSKFRKSFKEETIEDAEVEGPRTSKFRKSFKDETIEDAEVEGPRTSKFRKPVKEGTIENLEVEGPRTSKFRRPLKEETIEDAEFEGPRTSKFRRSPDKGESAANLATGSEKKSAGNASVNDPKGSVSVSGPVLRLRLETSADRSTLPDAKSDVVATPRVSLSESRTSSRSRSRGLPSITGSEISLNNREDDMFHKTIGCVRQESSSVWRSLEGKESSTPREKSANSREDRREYLRGDGGTVCGDPRASARSRDNDKTGYESSGCEEETDGKSEASSVHKDYIDRVKRTKQIIQKDGMS